MVFCPLKKRKRTITFPGNKNVSSFIVSNNESTSLCRPSSFTNNFLSLSLSLSNISSATDIDDNLSFLKKKKIKEDKLRVDGRKRNRLCIDQKNPEETRPREITVNSGGRPIGSGQTPTDLIPWSTITRKVSYFKTFETEIEIVPLCTYVAQIRDSRNSRSRFLTVQTRSRRNRYLSNGPSFFFLFLFFSSFFYIYIQRNLRYVLDIHDLGRVN